MIMNKEGNNGRQVDLKSSNSLDVMEKNDL